MLLAAQFACGPTAYLTGTTALALHGLRKPYLREIHVCTVGDARDIKDPTFSLHRTTRPPEPDELCHLGPLRYAALPRALLELARTEPVERLTGWITEAIHQGKLDHDRLLAVLDRHRNRPGAKKLSAAYGYYLPRPSSKSGLERSFDRRVKRRPSIPGPERNTYIEAGGIRWEIDRYYARERVALELDGRNFHTAELDRERDRVKDAKLAAIGILATRITDWRWESDPDGALDDLEAILAQRREAPPAVGAP